MIRQRFSKQTLNITDLTVANMNTMKIKWEGSHCKPAHTWITSIVVYVMFLANIFVSRAVIKFELNIGTGEVHKQFTIHSHSQNLSPTFSSPKKQLEWNCENVWGSVCPLYLKTWTSSQELTFQKISNFLCNYFLQFRSLDMFSSIFAYVTVV